MQLLLKGRRLLLLAAALALALTRTASAQQQQRQQVQHLRTAAPAGAGGAPVPGGYTRPDEVLKLLALKDELVRRGLGYLLGTWTCPDPNNVDTCNPCGRNSGKDDSWGYLGGNGGWEHIACRTYNLSPEEIPDWATTRRNINQTGIVTNIHLTDLGIEGDLDSLQDVLCPFNHLRELDLDGSHLTGALPRWLSTCFPHLHELDLSYGRFSGTLEDWVGQMPSSLEHFKVQHNGITGTIPAAFANLTNLHVLWLHHNNLYGQIPQQLATLPALVSVDVRYNDGLCGPLPDVQVNWTYQWEHRGDEIEDWFGFCDKAASENSACGLLATMGTHVGKPCGAANASAAACGDPWDQCGGAPNPSIYKGQQVSADVFSGRTCCAEGSTCVKRTQYFSQWRARARRPCARPRARRRALPCGGGGGSVPASDGSTADHALDSAVDINRLPPPPTCGMHGQQCGGAKGLYIGPFKCCNPADSCEQRNYYYSQCASSGGGGGASRS